jgi:hypothetical protein
MSSVVNVIRFKEEEKQYEGRRKYFTVWEEGVIIVIFK